MNVRSLKTRILALFGDESAAAEEAAELVAYNAMKAQAANVSSSLDEVMSLIDELVADEEENPTETAAQETAEEEVENARLDAIRMHCYSMMAALQSICNACSEQQMPDAPMPSDPRYMEMFKALIGKEISAKNAKVIQSAHDASHDMHTHTVALGAECSGMKAAAAGMKDCPTCDGTGQMKSKDTGKQMDCPTCDGEGQIKAAEAIDVGTFTIGAGFRAACGCTTTEDRMTKADRITALLKCEHNPVKELKTLEAASEDFLTILETQAKANGDMAAKHAAELKAANEKAATAEAALKAAQATQIPAEELAHLRSLAADKAATEAAEKASLVKSLEPLKTLSKEQLEAKSLDDLRTMARFARVEQPAADFSIKGIPVPRSAEGVDVYTPPDSYNLKALQAPPKKEAVN